MLMTPSKVLIITGVQRTGTTLLSLIFSVRPDTTVIDEAVFDLSMIGEYVKSCETDILVFKIPNHSHTLLDILRLLRGIDTHVIWPDRDLMDVIASMMVLLIPIHIPHLRWLISKVFFPKYTGRVKPISLPWSVHPSGARWELKSILPVLKDTRQDIKKDIVTTMSRFRPFYWCYDRTQSVKLASYCIYMKMQLKIHYKRRWDIDIFDLSYEKLVTHPESYLIWICKSLDIPFMSRMLVHHKYRSGTSIGGTINSEKIHAESIGKSKRFLLTSDKELIVQLFSREDLLFLGYSPLQKA